jgi:hypothetical protein
MTPPAVALAALFNSRSVCCLFSENVSIQICKYTYPSLASPISCLRAQDRSETPEELDSLETPLWAGPRDLKERRQGRAGQGRAVCGVECKIGS